MSDTDTPSNPSPQPEPETRETVRATTQPKTKADEALETSFYQDYVGQVERLDKFALELIKLQLAIPALYAGIVKLLELKAPADSATAQPDVFDPHQLVWVFLPWLAALVLSFGAVFPMGKYQVKPNPISEEIPKQQPNKDTAIAINVYFHFAAQRKFRCLAASGALTFIGITAALFISFR